jgi:GNAT superfamily N-acetyltransferase
MTDEPVVTDLVSYQLASSGDVSWALGAALRPGADVTAAAAELRATLPGTRVATSDEALVEALVSLGGRVQRRGHDYEYDLTTVPGRFAAPELPAGARLLPVGPADARALAPAHDAALPPDHPDHEAGLDHVDDLEQMLTGRVLGPLCADASWQVLVDGRPEGAVIVVARPEFGDRSARLWVVDIFLSPQRHGQGLGRALLQRSLHGAAAFGHELMGLVVTVGNPAQRLYESVGFRLVATGTNVDLPA